MLRVTIFSASMAFSLFFAAPSHANLNEYDASGWEDGQGHIIQNIERYFSALAAQNAFNGNILVAFADRPALVRSYGYAEHQLQIRLDPDHVFQIASLTKPVTAALVLRLVERGEIGLDQPFCERIDFCIDSWRRVTVRHLLAHRSGIPDYFGELGSVPVEDTGAEIRRMAGALAEDAALVFPAGQSYHYSNFNYVLLGALIEAVTGEGWERNVEEMADDMGARTLRYDRAFSIVPGRVRGYRRDTSGEIMNMPYLDHAAYAAGGLHASIHDFYRFARAVLSGSVLSRDMTALMLTPYPERYGLGWQITEYFGQTAYNHTGRTGGFAANIIHFPDNRLTVIVFTNVMNDAADGFACDAAAIAMDLDADEILSAPLVRAGLPVAQRCQSER